MADAAWFTGRTYSSSLRNRYLTSGWLQQVTRGVFRRPLYKAGHDKEAVPLHWQHVVISLQMIMKRPIVIGGRTALELGGYSHYTSSSGPREIHLYGDEPAPSWLKTLPLETRFVCHNARKLFREEPIAEAFETLNAVESSDAPDFPTPIHGSLMRTGFSDWFWWPVVLSMPERAVLEFLDELPDKETFHQADMLLEGLTNLSPKRLNRLLRECRSIKVKRLFLWFADRHRHAWHTRLDCDRIDLGSGKRLLVRGGRLDPKYQITVPKDLNAGE